MGLQGYKAYVLLLTIVRFSPSYDVLSRSSEHYRSGSTVQVYDRIHCRIRSHVDRSNYVLLYWIRQVHGLR